MRQNQLNDCNGDIMHKYKDIWYDQTKVTKYTSKWEQYYDVYETYFTKFVGKSPSVLEIGVDNGGNLEALYHYFGEGTVLFGFDIRQKFNIEDLNIPSGALSLFHGDQGSPESLDRFNDIVVNKLSLPLDIILDDGSHYMDHQILTFKKLFPHMNDGGIYLVEDTHSSYMDIFGGKRGAPHTFIEYCKGIVDTLHEDHDPTAPEGGWQSREGNLYRNIKSIHFYDSVVVIEKGLRQKYQVTYTHRSSYIR